ncbi:MAG: hypothetical protein WCL70_04980 [Paludibacter sp.]
MLFRYFYILSVVIGIHACSGSPQELKTAEQLMETAPDSSLHILQKLHILNIHGRNNRALYALLLSQALDKKEIYLENDSLITVAIDYFDESDPVHAGYAWFYHARTARNRGNLEEQAHNLLMAQEYAEKSENKLLMGAIVYDKATMYFNQRQYNYSISCFKSAIDYFKQIDEKRSLILSNLYIGYCYLYIQKIDSAQIYYVQAEKVATNIKDKILLSVILRNVGMVYLQQANYNEALRYFYKVPLTGNKLYDSSKYILIANAHIKSNRLDSARNYLHKVDDLHEIEADYYRLWQAIAEKEKDKTKALYFANKVSVLTDSMYKKKLETSFAGLEKKYKYQSLQIDNQNLNIKNKKKGMYLLLSLLALSVFIVVFLFWRLRVKKNEVEYQKDIAIKKQELLEKEQENTAREKENNTLLERQLKLQTILLSNIKMHQTNTVKRPTVWKDGSKETIEKQFETFYNELKTYVDMEFNNFTTRLKEKHPVLTENDIFISCLLLAEFETGMIATILNVQAESINKYRYRLRTKLKLANSDNLLDYLLHF